MSVVLRWTTGLAVLAFCAAPATAEQSSILAAFNYNLEENDAAAAAEDPVALDAPPPVANGFEFADEPCYGCDVGCYDCYGPGYGGWGACLGDCCLGSAWTLKCYVDPCCRHNYGGWFSSGYHSQATRFSNVRGDLGAMNDVPHNWNLHQAWLFFEREALKGGPADWGYRFDIMYGTDAQKTQAFGNPGGRWDASLDHGVYGWAMPQLYGEVAWGDWSVIFGKFFTIVGYEAVPAPWNFFYSHSFSHFNSEPFTHTGVLTTYSGLQGVDIYAGWTLGWDTGFDQFGGGSNFLGGFSADLVQDVNYAYILTAGDFGWRGEGYAHSNVFDVTLSNRMNYVLQSDYVNVRNVEGIAGVTNEDVGINQYLFYALNDCWKFGTRVEWWKSDAFTPNSQSYWGITYGLNYKPHANVVIRPEVRHNWTGGRDAYQAEHGVDFNQTVFGMDAVVTF